MPRKCCVPACRSNYRGCSYISTFRFPKSENLKELWIKKIPRANFKPTENSVVCINHFQDSDIIRCGDNDNVRKKAPKLKENSVPCIFKGLPSYLSNNKINRRRNPEERRNVVDSRYEQVFRNDLRKLVELNAIKSLDDVINFCKDLENLHGWMYRKCSEKVDFFFILMENPHHKLLHTLLLKMI